MHYRISYVIGCIALMLIHVSVISMHTLEITYKKLKEDGYLQPIAYSTTIYNYALNTRRSVCHLNPKLGTLGLLVENSPSLGYCIRFEQYSHTLNNTLYRHTRTVSITSGGRAQVTLKYARFQIEMDIGVIPIQHVE